MPGLRRRHLLGGICSVALLLSQGCGRAPEKEVTRLEPEQIREAIASARVDDLHRWMASGLLLDKRLDLTEALYLAVESGDETTTRAVLAAGPEPALITDALARAVRTGKSAPARALLEAGANPDALAEGMPLLAWALAARSTETTAVLIASGASVNQPLPTPAPEAFIQEVADPHFSYYLRRERNVTPLMLASSTGQLEAVRLLLAAGAVRNAKTAKHQTTAIWLAGKNQHVEVVQLLLGKNPAPEAQIHRIEISLSQQRATLLERDVPVLESPISSGKKGHPTPKGRFVVTNKYRDWRSTLYEDAPMPFFMRLNCSDFGLHAGRLPGYPASRGCIRLPQDKAAAFFEKTEIGTLVVIAD